MKLEQRILRKVKELYGKADDLEADGSYEKAGALRDAADAMAEELEEPVVLYDAVGWN